VLVIESDPLGGRNRESAAGAVGIVPEARIARAGQLHLVDGRHVGPQACRPG